MIHKIASDIAAVQKEIRSDLSIAITTASVKLYEKTGLQLKGVNCNFVAHIDRSGDIRRNYVLLGVEIETNAEEL